MSCTTFSFLQRSGGSGRPRRPNAGEARDRESGLSLLRRLGVHPEAGQHADRALVDIEQRLLLVEIVLVHLTEPDELAHDLGIEAGTLGLGVDFLDVRRERALLLLQALDALDEGFQSIPGDAGDI